MTTAKVELGRHLFYEKRMSVNGKLSCGAGHKQELAFTDGRAWGEGATGEIHPRASMGLVNIAYAPKLTWANPAELPLEQQALAPMLGEHPVELGLKGRERDPARNAARRREVPAVVCCGVSQCGGRAAHARTRDDGDRGV